MHRGLIEGSWHDIAARRRGVPSSGGGGRAPFEDHLNYVKERETFGRASSALGSAPLGTLRVLPLSSEEKGCGRRRLTHSPILNDRHLRRLASASHAVACPVPVLSRLGPT